MEELPCVSGQYDTLASPANICTEALKMFTGGGAGSFGMGGMGQGNSQNQFVGMAMGEAGKLFDQQSSMGNVNGSKESAIQSAGAMAMKMYMKSQGMGGGGGAGGLLSMASKFM